ncbi:serine hydrolase [cyanobacterium TDX16]|nr:serine hydrolase [cyanobacterium TDX16]
MVLESGSSNSGKRSNAGHKKGLSSSQQREQAKMHNPRGRFSPQESRLLPSEPRNTDRKNRSKTVASSGANGSRKATQETLPAPTRKQSKQRQHPQRQNKLIVYALRLLILGIGISAIAGTVLSALDPTTRITSEEIPVTAMEVMPQLQARETVAHATPLQPTQEITALKTLMQQLATNNTKLFPGMFFIDPETGAYLDWNGDTTFAAASTIKFPILVAFFQDVDAGKIRLDEKLTLKKELVGGGAGGFQYKPLGSQFTALETATQMIIVSDNTATNLLIERLGGIAALNQRFRNWGLTVTELRNLLPDLEGTNTTSPKELAQLMVAVQKGDLISVKSHDRLLNIMRRTRTATLLPKGLGPGATIAHKTGDIGSMVGDVGLVDLPSGKRYIAVAMVKRPHNNAQAKELIRQVSRAAYQEFSK